MGGSPQNHPFSIRIFHCKIKNHPATGVPPSKTHSKSSLTKPLKFIINPWENHRKSHGSSLIHGKLHPFFHPLKIDEENTRSSRSSRYHPHRSSRRAAVNPPAIAVSWSKAAIGFYNGPKKEKSGQMCLVFGFTMFHHVSPRPSTWCIYIYNKYIYIYIYIH